MPLMPRTGRARRRRALFGGCALAFALAGTQPGSAAPEAAPAPPTLPPPRVLALPDAVGIALENNRNIQTAIERQQAAEARVGQAAAPNRPQARLNANVTRNDKETTVSFPGGPDGAVQEVTIGPLYTSSAQLGLTQAIDISGALRLQRTIAELSADVSRLDVARTREQTVLDVKNAFYGVLRAEAALGVARANVASLEEHLRQVRAFFDVGVVAQYDVLRAEAQAANARQAEIAARNAVDLAKAALNNVMGIDVTTPLTVRGDGEPATAQPGFQESLAVAFRRRPEVLQAVIGTELARRGVSLARTGRWPTLAVGANLNAAGNASTFNPRTLSWNAVANVSLPILEGGLTRARVSEARANVDAAQVQEEQVREGVALEIQQSIVLLNDAAERLSAATQNVTQAAEALRLARLRYREGISTALEVTDAQTVLTQAESNVVNARYDYLLARARYERATGTGLAAALPATAPGAAPAEERK